MNEQDSDNAQHGLIDLYNQLSLQPAQMALGAAVKPLRFSLGSTESIKIVAQGDSWFDYLPGWDVLKSLTREGFAIKKFATGGDTLENMIYGNAYGTGWDRKPSEHKEVLDWVASIKPRFFLFSGGGNDVAGPELAAYLNHADANLGSDVRTDYLKYMIHTVFRSYYEHMVKTVKSAHGDVHILFHGYARPLVTGLGVVNIGGWHFVGPWLMPALTSKGITDPARQFRAIATIIEALNEMLEDLADPANKVHYVNLFGVVKPRHWINELHLNKEGYDLVGREFQNQMLELMNDDEKSRLKLAKADVDTFLASDGSQLQSLLGS